MNRNEGEASTSSRAATITLMLLLAAGGYIAYRVIQPFAGPILMGAVLAVLFYPLHSRVLSRIASPSLAAVVSTVMMLLLIIIPLTLLTMVISREVREIYQSLGPGGIDGRAHQVLDSVRGPLETLAARVGVDFEEVTAGVADRLGALSGTIVGRGVAVVGAATGGLVFIFLTPVVFFFALRDGVALSHRIVAWSPLGERHTWQLFSAAQQTIIASFYGVAAVATAQGILCGIGAWIAGLPSPLLWGVAGTCASVIPLVGSSLVWVPASAVLLLQGSVGKGVFMLAWGAGIVGTVDNLVRPLVVQASLPVNAFVLLIAMLGGVRAFGVAGILIGPVTLAVLLALFRILEERGVEERAKSVVNSASDLLP